MVAAVLADQSVDCVVASPLSCFDKPPTEDADLDVKKMWFVSAATGVPNLVYGFPGPAKSVWPASGAQANVAFDAEKHRPTWFIRRRGAIVANNMAAGDNYRLCAVRPRRRGLSHSLLRSPTVRPTIVLK